MKQRRCIICRDEWMTSDLVSDKYCMCYNCRDGMTGDCFTLNIYIQNDYFEIFDQFDYYYRSNSKWKGFYCGHGKWIIPEFMNEKETIYQINKIFGDEDTSVKKKFELLVDYLKEFGVDITQNIQIKQYGKSARSVI